MKEVSPSLRSQGRAFLKMSEKTERKSTISQVFNLGKGPPKKNARLRERFLHYQGWFSPMSE
jgi:hypothetical protein